MTIKYEREKNLPKNSQFKIHYKFGLHNFGQTINEITEILKNYVKNKIK